MRFRLGGRGRGGGGEVKVGPAWRKAVIVDKAAGRAAVEALRPVSDSDCGSDLDSSPPISRKLVRPRDCHHPCDCSIKEQINGGEPPTSCGLALVEMFL